MKVKRIFRWFVSIVLVIALAGCVTTVHKVRPDLSLRRETGRILLMPMDIELSALTAGGILEPNAEWTATANENVQKAIIGKFSQNGISLVVETENEINALEAEQKNLRTQLVKLHEAVGQTILMHQYLEPFKLPSKKGAFDWSLGNRARFLKEKFNSDYALFVYLRDSYASAGRVAVIVFAAAFGVQVPAGRQVGFASLVDLNSGQVVWFNRLMRAEGDLRTKAATSSSVEVLLTDLPI